jgi:hypothetical protein
MVPRNQSDDRRWFRSVGESDDFRDAHARHEQPLALSGINRL